MAELVDLPLPAGRRDGFKTQFEIMFYVYAISSQTRAYIYVGLTSDVENRLARQPAPKVQMFVGKLFGRTK